ncbi:uncharacterized protein APUU_21400A [Aspergillus puulaauensis]|uniref:Uncharacterized protein n=1 Tax=Aspergillus puulaauensis TaxID=1220207 RepID=A0A7R7XH09_9EURO|nr:uncharacterized protein APUU_21400A [Aspergillus puulaauensis]BCS20968.1 hypothetical protein APUU_21400A [Aspergillus puulaauensis]
MPCLPVTAGIIFFLIKKRKWDRIKQCEERLIDYQLTPGTGTGYSSKLNSRSVTPEDYQVYYPMTSPPPPTSTTAATAPAAYPHYPQAPTQAQTGGQQDRPALGHRTRGMSAPASTTLSTLTTGQPQPQAQTRAQHLTPESPPPAYQTLHARYDPSRYSQISARFSSAFDGPRSSSSTVGNPNRNTRGYTVSGMLPTTPESSSWFQQQQQQSYQYQPGPAVSGSGSGPASTWTSSSGAVTTTASSSSNSASRESTSEERGPRRPRPVLSRLITNL